MSITHFFVMHRRITITVVICLLYAGLSTYQSLPKDQNPEFTIRTAVITTGFPGASPENVELLITDALEEKIQEMPEIDSVTSESRTGISIINANFLESYKDMRPIFDDLRRKIEDISSELPDGATVPIVNDEYGDTFGHVYLLSGEGYEPKELKSYADLIRSRLLKERSVGKVEIYGDQKEIIFVEYNNAKLTEVGISPQQLASSLQALNILSSGGDILFGVERITLEPTGNFESVSDLESAVIEVPASGELVYLGDIANIYRGYEDPVEERVFATNQPALAIAVSLQEGGNVINLGNKLSALIPELESQLPLGVKLQPLFEQSTLTEDSVDAFLLNLLQSVGIVMIVMILTLGLRTGFVVASLIPIVMISTFFVMGQFDIGINQISLAALIIALGLLVDNAIVVVEATIVRRENGENAIEAAINAAREMMLPLLISSLTTAAAFTPIALAKSAVGEFASGIFYVVTIALLISWLLSMTFIPMLTPVVLRVKKSTDAAQSSLDSRFYKEYRSVLLMALRRPLVFSAATVVLFAISVYGMRFVPQVFIPPSEDPVLSAKLELPLGSSIERSMTMAQDIESFLYEEWLIDKMPASNEVGVTGWATYVGTGGPRFVLGFDPPNPNSANTLMLLNLTSSEAIKPMIEAVEDYVFSNHPDVHLQIKRLSNGPPVAYPIEVRVSGPEFSKLFQIVSDVKEQLWRINEITAVKDTWGPQSKKLIVDVDQARALRAGVTSSDIATSLNTGLSGMQMTEYRERHETIPISLKAEPSRGRAISRLENLTIFSQASQASVPLQQVADIEVVWQPGRVERRDRDRTITIQAQVRPGITAAEVMADIEPWLEEYSQSWSSQYRYESGGESEKSDNAAASIAAAIPVAGIMILLLLVIQFDSWRRTAIVLITIPCGFIGVVGGLLIAKSTFGFFTLLGLVSLAGIVINNAIVLLDRIRTEIDINGLQPENAVVAACLQRARPILLTTATTIGGMIPLWLSGGPMFAPMAIAILFGLLFATLITLLLVPVLYSVFFSVRYV